MSQPEVFQWTSDYHYSVHDRVEELLEEIFRENIGNLGL